MVTWTAEFTPYLNLYGGIAMVLAAGIILSLVLKSGKAAVVFTVLLVPLVVIAIMSPGKKQFSGELEAVEAQVVAVDSSGTYTFSNGAAWSGSYQLGETIQLLCIPSTIECAPDEGDLRKVQYLADEISEEILKKEGVLMSWAGNVKFVRHYEGEKP